jgi:hypothetical protein
MASTSATNAFLLAANQPYYSQMSPQFEFPANGLGRAPLHNHTPAANFRIPPLHYDRTRANYTEVMYPLANTELNVEFQRNYRSRAMPPPHAPSVIGERTLSTPYLFTPPQRDSERFFVWK